MSKSLFTWIVPLIEQHEIKYGSDLSVEVVANNPVQVVRFETFRTQETPHTPIRATVSDKTHQIQIIFDPVKTTQKESSGEDRLTSQLRSIIRLKTFKYSFLPLPSNNTNNNNNSSGGGGSNSRITTGDEKHGQPQLRGELILLVSDWEWQGGGPDQPLYHATTKPLSKYYQVQNQTPFNGGGSGGGSGFVYQLKGCGDPKTEEILRRWWKRFLVIHRGEGEGEGEISLSDPFGIVNNDHHDHNDSGDRREDGHPRGLGGEGGKERSTENNHQRTDKGKTKAKQSAFVAEGNQQQEGESTPSSNSNPTSSNPNPESNPTSSPSTFSSILQTPMKMFRSFFHSPPQPQPQTAPSPSPSSKNEDKDKDKDNFTEQPQQPPESKHKQKHQPQLQLQWPHQAATAKEREDEKRIVASIKVFGLELEGSDEEEDGDGGQQGGGAGQAGGEMNVDGEMGMNMEVDVSGEGLMQELEREMITKQELLENQQQQGQQRGMPDPVDAPITTTAPGIESQGILVDETRLFGEGEGEEVEQNHVQVQVRAQKQAQGQRQEMFGSSQTQEEEEEDGEGEGGNVASQPQPQLQPEVEVEAENEVEEEEDVAIPWETSDEEGGKDAEAESIQEEGEQGMVLDFGVGVDEDEEMEDVRPEPEQEHEPLVVESSPVEDPREILRPQTQRGRSPQPPPSLRQRQRQRQPIPNRSRPPPASNSTRINTHANRRSQSRASTSDSDGFEYRPLRHSHARGFGGESLTSRKMDLVVPASVFGSSVAGDDEEEEADHEDLDQHGAGDREKTTQMEVDNEEQEEEEDDDTVRNHDEMSVKNKEGTAEPEHQESFEPQSQAGAGVRPGQTLDGENEAQIPRLVVIGVTDESQSLPGSHSESGPSLIQVIADQGGSREVEEDQVMMDVDEDEDQGQEEAKEPESSVIPVAAPSPILKASHRQQPPASIFANIKKKGRKSLPALSETTITKTVTTAVKVEEPGSPPPQSVRKSIKRKRSSESSALQRQKFKVDLEEGERGFTRVKFMQLLDDLRSE